MDNNIFYWTGNLYDDTDFLEYKNKKIINTNNNTIIEDNSNETPNSTNNKEQLYLNKKLYPKNKIIDFKFNEKNNDKKI